MHKFLHVQDYWKVSDISKSANLILAGLLINPVSTLILVCYIYITLFYTYKYFVNLSHCLCPTVCSFRRQTSNSACECAQSMNGLNGIWTCDVQILKKTDLVSEARALLCANAPSCDLLLCRILECNLNKAVL